MRYAPLQLKVLRWGKPLDAELPPVMAAEWRNTSGRRMLAVVNATETPRRFAHAEISLELEPLEIKLVTQTETAKKQ